MSRQEISRQKVSMAMGGLRRSRLGLSCLDLGLRAAGGAHCDASADRRIALDLRAMQDAARMGVEGVATMQHAEIVPHQHVSDLPGVVHAERSAYSVCPQVIEQCLAVGY